MAHSLALSFWPTFGCCLTLRSVGKTNDSFGRRSYPIMDGEFLLTNQSLINLHFRTCCSLNKNSTSTHSNIPSLSVALQCHTKPQFISPISSRTRVASY